MSLTDLQGELETIDGVGEATSEAIVDTLADAPAEDVAETNPGVVPAEAVAEELAKLRDAHANDRPEYGAKYLDRAEELLE